MPSMSTGPLFSLHGLEGIWVSPSSGLSLDLLCFLFLQLPADAEIYMEGSSMDLGKQVA